jgi:hypothetical protein
VVILLDYGDVTIASIPYRTDRTLIEFKTGLSEGLKVKSWTDRTLIEFKTGLSEGLKVKSWTDRTPRVNINDSVRAKPGLRLIHGFF